MRTARGLFMLKPSCYAAVLLISLLGTTTASAEQRYVVKRGDSLSSIAAQQLGSASRWREIWALNPSIRRPEQLAVGAALRLPESGKTTQTTSSNTSAAQAEQRSIESDPAYQLALELIKAGRVKLLRQNYRLLDKPNQSISLHAVRHEPDGLFLYSSQYNQHTNLAMQYGIYQPSTEPVTRSTTELTRIGSAKLALQQGDLAGFKVTANLSEPKENSLLLPLDSYMQELKPHYPARAVSSTITKALYEQSGGYILTLNQGSKHGLEPGHLLQLEQRNPVESENGRSINFPGPSTGWALVFETSSNLSLALVLSAQRVPAVGDSLH